MPNVFDQFDGSTNPFDRFDVAPPADPYRQAAIEERDRLKAAGIDTGAGLTRRVLQGRTFGFGDEITAAAMTPLEMIRQRTANPAEGYRYAKARENLILEDARNETGIGGALAEGLGGMVTAGNLAKGGLSMVGRLSPSSTLLTKIGVGGLEGAAYGGVYGAGEGEGIAGRATEAAKGAAFGGVTGGAFPLLSAGAVSGWRALKDSQVGKEIARQTGESPAVMRLMGNAIDADGTLGPRGAQNMLNAGPEAMLADAGPNARAILDTSIQRGGPGAVLARDAIAARTQRGATDLTASLDNVLGQPEGVTAAQTAIRQGSSSGRQAAYEAAYAQPINYADPRGVALEQLVKGRVPASAIRDANALMRLEGNASKQIKATIADDGSVAYEAMPDVRQIDYIKRALDQAAQSGDGAGALGGQTPLGRAYSNLASELRDHAKDLVPEYANALRVAADPIRQSKAIEFGSKLLSPSMTRDGAAEAVQGMTAAEKRAAAQGVRSNIDDAMARVTRTVQDGDVTGREAVKALKDLSSRSNRDKLAMVVGPQRAQQLFREVDRVATSFDLRASVAQNSKTYARQATDQRVQNLTQPGPIGATLQGQPINATKRLIQMITGMTPEKVAGRQDAIYSDVSRLLTQPAAKAVPLFKGMAKLTRAEARNQAKAAAAQRLIDRAQPTFVQPATMALDHATRPGLPDEEARAKLMNLMTWGTR